MTTASDRFAQTASLDAPLDDIAAVTPSDTDDLPRVSRALWIGTAGDVKVTSSKGTVTVVPGLTVGWHPLRVRRVWATGTTASQICWGD